MGATSNIKRLGKSLVKTASLKKFDIENYLIDLKKISDNNIAYDFIEPTDPQNINISINSKSVKCIKIYLNNSGFLNLHSIEIFSNGFPIQTSGIEVTCSSYYGDSKKRIDDWLTFDPNHNLIWSIHTKFEKKPELIIKFPKPTQIDNVIINNRKDHNSIRSLGIRVDLSNDGYTYNNIYKYIDNTIYKPLIKKYRINKLKSGDELHSFSISVAACNYDLARKQFGKLPENYKLLIRDAVNRIVLYDRQLEWTGHGAKHSFRFWSKKEKTDYLKFTIDIISELKNISKDICLSSGSVLAAVRDGDLIKHDDDIDIMIAIPSKVAPTLTEAKKIIENFVSKTKYRVSGEYFAHRKISNGRFHLDLFVGIYEDNDEIGWYPHRRKAFKRSDIFPAVDISLLGIRCPVPANYIDYLEECYGRNWRTPDPSWTIKWDQESYRDIA